MSRSDAAAAVRASLQQAVDSGQVAGAVGLVAARQGVLATENVGFCDLADRRPMTANSLFWIASMSKPFAGAAVEMLMAEGRLKIDDRVDQYLPEFKNVWVREEETANRLVLRRPHHPITLRHLMTHTSGLRAASALELPHADQLTLEENVRVYPLEPLEFEPATRCVYTSAGINTAGRIVELVSGMPYAEFLQRRLFEPLGMHDTTFWPNAEQLGRLAKCYRGGSGGRLEETRIGPLTYPLGDPGRGVSPGGGLFSTAADLAIFCRMILSSGTLGGRVYLSAERVGEMTMRHTADLYFEEGRTDSGWGYGWRVMLRDSGPDGPVSQGSYGHGGAYATNMWIDPQSGLITIFMVQRADYPLAERVAATAAFRRSALAFRDRG